MGRRSGACAHCGGHRRLRRGVCRRCRWGDHRADAADTSLDIGEAAAEAGAFRAVGHAVRAFMRALLD
ncbi:MULTISPECIES: hypothetical protein [Streptomyces]|uniref:hypothetical protein n=1 Tax=Streptomyces TaxID=1883 RepID=UPI0011AFF514|nr:MULTISPECIES: hypothetical protein [unclassified Streptomyces]